MVPWTNQPGHLEVLCKASAEDADRRISAQVDAFMATIGADRWESESRKGKAWLRVSLAARCESDPFVPLGYVFKEARFKFLVPLNHASFNPIADFLAAV
jgi:hypothetical protein